jgi:uncharacterized protein (DUF1499 family)
MMLLILSFLIGSRPGDLPADTTLTHPFSPCPDSPNCIIYSTRYNVAPEVLHQISLDAINYYSPYSVEADSQSLQIKAVFRIALFGFKDDVSIVIHPANNGKSEFHIRSASRVGNSDLGVNRRRVKRILNFINNNI